MFVLILAETALEGVPRELWKHPSVLKYASSKKKKVGELLLDRSYHHAAMLKLKDSERRGRPDIAHFSILEATSSPLYIKRSLNVHVHTVTDHVINLGRSVRVPKSYFRFEGLIEKLFKKRRIVTPDNEILLEMKKQSFRELISESKPSIVIGLSKIGKRSTFEVVAKEMIKYYKPALIVGGFPRGHFSQEISSNFDLLCSCSTYSLESHVVIARIIYEFEKLSYIA